MRLYLIRHVQTVDNQKGCYCGQIETAISDEGYRQIERLSNIDFLRHISKAFVSPMKRTVQTAEAFCDAPIVIQELKEIHFGEMEGLTFKQVRDTFPREYQKMIEQGDDYQYPKGESLPQFCRRVQSGLQQILDRVQEEEEVAIVAHAGTIRVILSLLLEQEYHMYWRFRVDNASISVVEIRDDFAVIEALNLSPEAFRMLTLQISCRAAEK